MAENIARSEAGRVHGPKWLKWLEHLRTKPALGMEIGTFEGDSAEWMLENVFIHPDSCYHCVDTFAGSVEHHIAAATGNFPTDITRLEQTTREKLARFKNVVIHKGYSQAVVRLEPSLQLLAGKMDAIYVDGDHTSMGTLRDAVLSFDLLKVGGIMIFDDYAWTVMPNPIDCPKIGIDAFLAAYAKHVQVMEPKGWQIAVWKTREN